MILRLTLPLSLVVLLVGCSTEGRLSERVALCGDQVRIVADTWTDHTFSGWPPGPCGGTTRSSGEQAWVFTIDIPTDDGAPAQPVLYGPTRGEHAPGWEELLSPDLSFTPDGELIRTTREGSRYSLDRLTLNDGARWEPAAGKTVPEVSCEIGSLTDQHGHFRVQGDGDGIVRVYDLRTGAPIQDEWLAGAYLSAKATKQVCLELASDLKYVLAHDSKDRYSECIYFERPDPRPRTWKLKSVNSDTRFYSIDGELVVLEAPYGLFSEEGPYTFKFTGFGHNVMTPTGPAPRTLVLRGVDGRPRFEWSGDLKFPRVGEGRYGYMDLLEPKQMDEARGRLFCCPGQMSASISPQIYIIWDFRDGKVRPVRVDFADLFQIGRAGAGGEFNEIPSSYRPRGRAIPITDERR